MADTKISALAAVSSLGIGDQFAIAQAGSSFAVTGGQLTTFMRGWTYLKVSSGHFAVSNILPRSITGLGFLPQANSTYEFEGIFALRTGSSSINPIIGIAWPNAVTTAQGWINQAQSPTAQIQAFGGHWSTHVRTTGGSLATSNFAYPAILGGFFTCSSTPTSNFSITLASETSSTIFVSSLISSFVKYRIIP